MARSVPSSSRMTSLGIPPSRSGTSAYATTSTTPYGRYGDKAQAWRDQQINETTPVSAMTRSYNNLAQEKVASRQTADQGAMVDFQKKYGTSAASYRYTSPASGNAYYSPKPVTYPTGAQSGARSLAEFKAGRPLGDSYNKSPSGGGTPSPMPAPYPTGGTGNFFAPSTSSTNLDFAFGQKQDEGIYPSWRQRYIDIINAMKQQINPYMQGTNG